MKRLEQAVHALICICMATDVLAVPLPVWIKRITASMELDVSILTITDWYAIGLTGFLVLLALRRAIRIILRCICPPVLRRLGRRISQWAVRCLAYRGPFRRGSSVDIITWAHILIFLSYLTSNLSCIIIGAGDVVEACSRAGKLAFINLIILYIGPCLDFIASVLRFRLRVQRRIHAGAGYVVAILSTIHAVGAFSRHGLSAIDQGHSLYATLVAGIFLGSLTWQVGETVYMNGWWFQSVSLSQNGSYDYIQVRMTLRKPVKVEPGQYINLWIPLGPLSGLQSHTFTVANWSIRAQTELKVFVGVNRGLTSKLRDAVKRGLKSNIGLYMGPYGATIAMKGYETILLVATGLGVVAVAPYLQGLVHATRAHEIRSAPVHLIWHIPSWKQAHAVFDIIDFALALDEGDDTEEGGGKPPQISGIKISMCYEEEKSSLPPKVQLFIREMEKKESEKPGRTRIKVYNRDLPLETLLINDAVISPAQGDSEKPTMIAASVSKDMRNKLVKFAGEHSSAVDLVFTDYQP
ncbi:hypothetical protein FOXG_15957 [Fusarium oxysporum f. sp. lycopersici 4287]|uniref:ferric-chelate reductase (NADPH) n=1 Tax=Fusarium oxysporum f. sp. lycopersici (strain 4287 / CBS 123668 / FGSC 9935 / NRRL 34936) TaxID=426428 RepID=A0A0J9WUR5_FUSO4|nr:uncharacterized protein FOXG_15957 [Fusarium oxysporum f. sp. lycopersici 4287]KNB18242.1 hypothetical protein FOXG_15957 [Fusarium oxysporum f. sp. lycopersici 4287]